MDCRLKLICNIIILFLYFSPFYYYYFFSFSFIFKSTIFIFSFFLFYLFFFLLLAGFMMCRELERNQSPLFSIFIVKFLQILRFSFIIIYSASKKSFNCQSTVNPQKFLVYCIHIIIWFATYMHEVSYGVSFDSVRQINSHLS